MIKAVMNSPSFAGKVPAKPTKWISRTEYQQNQIEQLRAQIGIINRDTDSLYKNGYDVAGRLTKDARVSIAKNESAIDGIKSKIDLLKTEISRRFEQ